jgi:hypothetical protein
MPTPMRVTFWSLAACAAQLFAPASAAAQDPPPRIPLFVVDVRGSLPGFPREPQLAASRGLQDSELPGRGLGADLGLHLRVFRWKAMTVGIGGQVTVARAVSASVEGDGQAVTGGVSETFASVTPQLSFNFGDGDGWSYISGGIGPSQWQVIPERAGASAADEERLRSVNYGGGARWFIKPHLAFTFDVRFHQIDPGTPHFGFPGSPRTTLLIMGAGISLK